MIVLAVMAVLAAIVTPRFASAQSRYEADLAAGRLAGDLRLVQRTARECGVRLLVKFDFEKVRYQLPAAIGGATPVVELSAAPFRAKLSGAAWMGERGVAFDPLGRATSSMAISLFSGDNARTVRVTSGSTAIEVDRVPLRGLGQVGKTATDAEFAALVSVRRTAATDSKLRSVSASEIAEADAEGPATK
ncbi:MAG: hypothetical protein K2X32_03100 [Phycisphaerales bacterium]|nr:hypothetical protein [Phycisphaerales bacterium]